MARLDLAQESGSQRELHVRALILEGTAAVKAHQAALGVHAVKCPLRPVEDIHAVDVIDVEVEGTPAQDGHAVHIDSHSRRVDARTDPAHIDGRGIAASILGHGERRHEGRQLPHVLHVEALQLRTVEGGAAQGLLPETESLLGLIDDDDFVDVIHSGGISFFNGIISMYSRWQGCGHQERNT